MNYAEARFSLPPVPPATKHLLLANVAVFVANMLVAGRLSDPAGGSGGFWFACSWPLLWEGYGLGLLRLVTYQFTHSFGDPLHLLLNLMVLYFFGAMAEARLGYRGTLRLYLLGGLAGGLLHLGVAALQGQAGIPVVGASGACYAFLLYAACIAPYANVYVLFVTLPLWALAALLVLLGLYSTFVEFVRAFPGGVSHGAHLGGAAFGFVAARQGWLVDHGTAGGNWFGDLLARFRARRAARAQQAAAARELQLDAILAKVKAEGLGALSPAEKRFLEQSSERARRGG